VRLRRLSSGLSITIKTILQIRKKRSLLFLFVFSFFIIVLCFFSFYCFNLGW
jgi:hypothetical protein